MADRRNEQIERDKPDVERGKVGGDDHAKELLTENNK